MSFALKMIMAQMKKQPGFSIGEGVDYEAQRKTTEDPKRQMPCAKGTSFESITLGGVPCERVTPKKLTSDSVIFYIHGGGFVNGNAFTSRPYASVLADECGMLTYTISYRLAPENKFPAGMDDCFAAYKALLEAHPGKKIALVGESAGGNLVLVTALRARDEGLPMPACIYAQSPSTNLNEPFPSTKTNHATDFILGSVDIDAALIREYVEPGTDLSNPYISPYYGDYAGFPPLFVTADEGELLFDDSAELVKKAKAAGVDVTFLTQQGTFHTFPMMAGMTPESKKILEQSTEFLLKWNS